MKLYVSMIMAIGLVLRPIQASTYLDEIKDEIRNETFAHVKISTNETLRVGYCYNYFMNDVIGIIDENEMIQNDLKKLNNLCVIIDFKDRTSTGKILIDDNEMAEFAKTRVIRYDPFGKVIGAKLLLLRYSIGGIVAPNGFILDTTTLEYLPRIIN